MFILKAGTRSELSRSVRRSENVQADKTWVRSPKRVKINFEVSRRT